MKIACISKLLEKERVLRTSRPSFLRAVRKKRSMWLVSPSPNSWGRCWRGKSAAAQEGSLSVWTGLRAYSGGMLSMRKRQLSSERSPKVQPTTCRVRRHKATQSQHCPAAFSKRKLQSSSASSRSALRGGRSVSTPAGNASVFFPQPALLRLVAGAKGAGDRPHARSLQAGRDDPLLVLLAVTRPPGSKHQSFATLQALHPLRLVIRMPVLAQALAAAMAAAMRYGFSDHPRNSAHHPSNQQPI